MFVAMDIVGLLPWLSGQECWIIGPDHKQSRREAEYLIDWTTQLGLFDARRATLPGGDQPWRFVLKNGTVIRTFSAVNYRKLAGSTPSYVAMVEPGQIPDAEPFYTALARAGLRGCPLTLAGTLEGSTNWYADLAQRWTRGDVPGAMAYKMPTWSNTFSYPGGRTDPKIVAVEHGSLPHDTFLERYAGERVAPPGLVFGKTDYSPGFDSLKHVRPIRLGEPDDVDPTGHTLVLPADTPLQVWVDWGWDHPYAVLFAAVVGDPASVYILREIVLRGVRDTKMIALAASTPLWPNVQRAILDPATKQHHGGPLTTVEYWKSDPPLGAGLPCWADEIVQIQDGTDRIRALLEDHPLTGRPRLQIDPGCRHTIWEFREGYRNYVDIIRGNTGRPIPLHDDCIKAIHYGTHVNFPGLVEKRRKMRVRTLRRALPFA